MPAPPLKAKFGVENESDGLTFTRGEPRNTVMANITQGVVKTDDTQTNPLASHWELASEETRKFPKVDAAAKDVAGSVARALQYHRTHGKKNVPATRALAQVCPGQEHQRIKVLGLAPRGRTQSTYGVGLADFDRFLEYHHRPSVKDGSRELAQRIEQRLSQTPGAAPLTPNLRGFVQLLSYCMTEGRQSHKSNNRSPKTGFALCMRSDFYSVFHELLTPQEQQQAAAWLKRQDDGQDAPLLRAAGFRGQSRFFATPYTGSESNRVEVGPSYEEWFDSIVDGRRDGVGHYLKDLLSPPPGENETMGLQGVDTINKLMLFEMRARDGRPRHTLLNSHLRTAFKEEFNIACEFNPRLGAPIEISLHERQWVRASDPAIRALCDFHARFLAKGRRRAPMDSQHGRRLQLRMLMDSHSQLGAVFHLLRQFRDLHWNEKYPRLQTALEQFVDALATAGQEEAFKYLPKEERRRRKDSSSKAASTVREKDLDRAAEAMDELLQAMWNVDQVDEVELEPAPLQLGGQP